MSSPFKQRCIVLIAGAILGAPTAAMAEGLGDLVVKSHLGEVFRAEITVLGRRSSFSEACIVQDPAQNDPETGLPRLRDAFITLDVAGSKLLVTSRQRISEPALHISLTIACGSHVTRNYVALLSPREMTAAGASEDLAEKIQPRPKVASAKRSAVARPPRPKSAVSTASAAPMAPAATAVAPAPSAAVPPAPAPAPAKTPPAGERLELSPASSELEQIENEIAALNDELKRLSAGSETQSAETQTRILEMETRLVRMELRAARARLQSATPTAGGPPAAQLPAPPPLAVTPPPATAGSGAEMAKTPRRVDRDADGGSGLWAGLGLFAVLVAALVAFLVRRATRGDDEREAQPAPLATPAPRAGARAHRAGDAAPVAAQPGVMPDIVVDPDTLPPATPAEFSADLAEAAELPPDAEVVKLAEVMSAFGRIDGAVEALRAFVRENPENAVRPNLFLLKIYKEQGDRNAYEEVADKLRGDARLGALDWDAPVEDIQRLLSSAA